MEKQQKFGFRKINKQFGSVVVGTLAGLLLISPTISVSAESTESIIESVDEIKAHNGFNSELETLDGDVNSSTNDENEQISFEEYEGAPSLKNSKKQPELDNEAQSDIATMPNDKVDKAQSILEDEAGTKNEKQAVTTPYEIINAKTVAERNTLMERLADEPDEVIEERAGTDYGNLDYIPVTNEATDQWMYDFNEGTHIDHDKVREFALELVNEARVNENLTPLKYDPNLQVGTTIRTNDLLKIGGLRVDGKSHVRPDKSSWINAFEYLERPEGHKMGENTAMATFDGNPYRLLSERQIAERTFEQFINSPSHRRNILRPEFTTFAFDAKINRVPLDSRGRAIFGKDKVPFLFSVQIFGTDSIETIDYERLQGIGDDLKPVISKPNPEYVEIGHETITEDKQTEENELETEEQDIEINEPVHDSEQSEEEQLSGSSQKSVDASKDDALGTRLPDTATASWALGLIGAITLGLGGLTALFDRKDD